MLYLLIYAIGLIANLLVLRCSSTIKDVMLNNLPTTPHGFISDDVNILLFIVLFWPWYVSVMFITALMVFIVNTSLFIKRKLKNLTKSFFFPAEEKNEVMDVVYVDGQGALRGVWPDPPPPPPTRRVKNDG